MGRKWKAGTAVILSIVAFLVLVVVLVFAVVVHVTTRKSVFANTLAYIGLKAAPVVQSVPAGYSLVWSDEFDTGDAPDPSKWEFSVGGRNGWGNAEVQSYTNTRENSFVKDGKLSIVARKDGGMWSSAKLKTQYKADWTYGYIEVRARIPRGVGTWAAIWMLPTFAKYGEWPRSGEIDIMEHVGYQPDDIYTTAHTLTFNSRENKQKTLHAPVPKVSTRFHLYAVEWTPDYLQWYIDGAPFYRFDNPKETEAEWPFDIPYYLIMNLSIGGTLGGKEGIDEKMTEARMDVDYVRIYRKQ